MVKVQFVDYGNSEDVRPWEIKELDADFLHLPAQAFHCRLFNLQPPPSSSGQAWSDAASELMSVLGTLNVDDPQTRRTARQLSRMLLRLPMES